MTAIISATPSPEDGEIQRGAVVSWNRADGRCRPPARRSSYFSRRLKMSRTRTTTANDSSVFMGAILLLQGWSLNASGSEPGAFDFSSLPCGWPRFNTPIPERLESNVAVPDTVQMEGSLKKRGKHYRMRISLGRDHSGKRLYETRTLRMPYREAQAYMRTRLAELERLAHSTGPERLTLQAYLDRWLNAPSRVASPKARTPADKRALVDRYLRGTALAGQLLHQVEPIDIQRLYDQLLKRGLAAGTVKNLHSVLSGALRRAVKWKLIPSNPASQAELPPARRSKVMRPLMPQEAERFLAARPQDQYGTLFGLLLASGMRPGEGLGLHWSDVDFERARIHVTRVLVRVPKKKGWRLESPKNNQSERTIDLAPEIMQELAELHARHVAAGGRDDFCFRGRTGQPLHEGNLVARQLKPLLRASGVGAHHRLYDLRHTCATLMLLLGIPVKVISERLGHASVTITQDTYSAVLPTMQRESANKLGALLYKRGDTSCPTTPPESP